VTRAAASGITSRAERLQARNAQKDTQPKSNTVPEQLVASTASVDDNSAGPSNPGQAVDRVSPAPASEEQELTTEQTTSRIRQLLAEATDYLTLPASQLDLGLTPSTSRDNSGAPNQPEQPSLNLVANQAGPVNNPAALQLAHLPSHVR
jgi:hypothetical protein